MMVLLIRLCEKHANIRALLEFSGGDVEVAVRVLPSLLEAMPHDTEVCLVAFKLWCELSLPWSYLTHKDVKEDLPASAQGFQDVVRHIAQVIPQTRLLNTVVDVMGKWLTNWSSLEEEVLTAGIFLLTGLHNLLEALGGEDTARLSAHIFHAQLPTKVILPWAARMLQRLDTARGGDTGRARSLHAVHLSCLILSRVLPYMDI